MAPLSNGIALDSAIGDFWIVERSMTSAFSVSLCFGTRLSGRSCIPLCLLLIQAAPAQARGLPGLCKHSSSCR